MFPLSSLRLMFEVALQLSLLPSAAVVGAVISCALTAGSAEFETVERSVSGAKMTELSTPLLKHHHVQGEPLHFCSCVGVFSSAVNGFDFLHKPGGGGKAPAVKQSCKKARMFLTSSRLILNVGSQLRLFPIAALVGTSSSCAPHCW